MNLSFRGPCISLFRSVLRGAAAACAVALAACSDPVGSGVAPQSVIIAAPAPNAPVALQTLQTFECLTSQVRAIMVFSNGSEGNFTARVKWSSSNPGAVAVSNGDIKVNGGTGFYAPGVLVPVQAGNAIITADYDGIISHLPVSVGTPDSIQLKAFLYGDYIPLTSLNNVGNGSSSSSGGSSSGSSGGGSFTLGNGTSEKLAVTALLNGVETDISDYAVFGFQVPDSNVAVFEAGSSTLEAINEGGPLVPVASFPPCDLTNITDPTNIISFNVSRVQNITLQPEFAGSSSSSSSGGSSSGSLPQLIVGNTEMFKVIATLANGAQQDVSTQSTLTSSAPTIASFTGTVGTTGNNILHALIAGGPVDVSATYLNGGEYLTAPTVQTSTLTSTLSTITSCWTDLYTRLQNCPEPPSPAVASVQAGCLTPNVQFHTFGTYETVDASGNHLVQDITRQTVWTSTNNGVATISNSAINAGQPTGVSGGSVIIEGIDSAAENISQVFEQLNVAPIADTAPVPCI